MVIRQESCKVIREVGSDIGIEFRYMRDEVDQVSKGYDAVAGQRGGGLLE